MQSTCDFWVRHNSIHNMIQDFGFVHDFMTTNGPIILSVSSSTCVHTHNTRTQVHTCTHTTCTRAYSHTHTCKFRKHTNERGVFIEVQKTHTASFIFSRRQRGGKTACLTGRKFQQVQGLSPRFYLNPSPSYFCLCVYFAVGSCSEVSVASAAKGVWRGHAGRRPAPSVSVGAFCPGCFLSLSRLTLASVSSIVGLCKRSRMKIRNERRAITTDPKSLQRCRWGCRQKLWSSALPGYCQPCQRGR
jgi:hypothetical protein